eukprot:TRINITY_DN3353_c0_g1_i1.p1 TRINITY_DN3353_c0_g1~~TRINITY_DN3353_c0_g1_i1.p1  ORF type:complete len:461 (-),score=129.05 TRINITY_DN3353_c0_g1_i1:22-1404(-)
MMVKTLGSLKMMVLIFFGLFFAVAAIPVSVMLPLDTVSRDGIVKDPNGLLAQFKKLKSGGVDGVMLDFWWGIVERSEPQTYNWKPYLQIASITQQAGLTLQPVMSFHQCGTNIGDACFIPLPDWVLEIGKKNPDIFYKDSQGQYDQEYLTLGIDDKSVLRDRTAVQVYNDVFVSFSQVFQQYLGSTINEVQVGLGPAGEMRYPSYQLQNNKWSYCGIGEFQSKDKYMMEKLAKAASSAGRPDWGTNTPSNAGGYNSHPQDTGFFSSGSDNYQSPYGNFFLKWYTGMLLNHGKAILSRAYKHIGRHGVGIAAKVSGIHWWYDTQNHAAEATAGYFNTDMNDGYLTIAQMFKSVNATFDFTCLEMYDEPNSGCASKAATLVNQTRNAARVTNIPFSGENAIQLCSPDCQSSTASFNQIYTQSTVGSLISRFTYLRLDSNLLQDNNFNVFSNFVKRMASARSN